MLTLLLVLAVGLYRNKRLRQQPSIQPSEGQKQVPAVAVGGGNNKVQLGKH